MVEPINNSLQLLNKNLRIESEPDNTAASKDFSDILQQNLQEVNQLQESANKVTQDFVLGKIDNVHKVAIATEKARIAMDMTLSVQNKVIDAYNKLMRIQV